MNTIQYIVVNKDLGMSSGKAMAQVAHAVNLVSSYEDVNAYHEARQRTVIVLEGTEDQITSLWQYLDDRNVRSEYVIDEGANEIPTMSVTAIAVEQFDIEDQETRDFFKGFTLYGDHSNDAYKAWVALSGVVNKGKGWFGAPWHVRKTIKWLNEKRHNW